MIVWTKRTTKKNWSRRKCTGSAPGSKEVNGCWWFLSQWLLIRSSLGSRKRFLVSWRTTWKARLAYRSPLGIAPTRCSVTRTLKAMGGIVRSDLKKLLFRSWTCLSSTSSWMTLTSTSNKSKTIPIAMELTSLKNLNFWIIYWATMGKESQEEMPIKSEEMDTKTPLLWRCRTSIMETDLTINLK